MPVMWAKTSSLLALAALLLAVSGCAGSKPGELASERASQGAPCEAAGLHEGSEAQQNKIQEECTEQKDQEAREKEAHSESEAIREGERLKEEGK
jgi:Flp pilus assembly protein TadD